MYDFASYRIASCASVVVAVLLWSTFMHEVVAVEPDEINRGTPIACSLVGQGGGVEHARIHVVFAIPPSSDDSVNNIAEPIVIEETIYNSDGDGRYEIVPPDLELPDVVVSIEISHPQYLTRSLPTVSLAELRRHPRSTHRRTALKRAHLVTGRILLPDGTVASQTLVTAASRYRAYSWKYHDPNEYSATTTVITDQTGQFTVATDHDSTFIIQKEGFATLLVDRFDAMQVAPVTFRLPVGHRITGRVLDIDNNGLSNVVVSASRKFVFSETDMPLAYAEATVTDETGAYELPPLPADNYLVRVEGRFKNAATAQSWLQTRVDASSLAKAKRGINKLTKGAMTTIADPLPMQTIYMDQQVALRNAQMVVDHRPHENVTISLLYQWPDGRNERERETVGIRGTFMAREWRGSFVDVTDNQSVKLLAPRGLANASLLTGMVKFRRTADGPVELGSAIPLGTLASSRHGLVVIKPATAKLVAETIPGTKQPPGIRFQTSYVRDGYRDRHALPGRLMIHGRTINGSQYEATMLSDEEIEFEVVSQGTVVYSKRLKLNADEVRKLKIDLSEEGPVGTSIP